MEYKINGTVMQSLEITLSQGEAIFTESGGMAWMSDGLEMKTSGRGGIGKSLGRMLAGESLFLTTYTCTAPQAMITFTTESPGKVLPVPLREGYSMICQKDAFMCAEDTVDLAMHFRKRLGTGLFGGEGFILQKLTGPGTAFVEIAGEVQMYELQPGQRLRDRPRPNRDVRADLRLRHRDGEGPHRTGSGGGEGLSWRPSPAPARSGCKPCRSPTWRPSCANICRSRVRSPSPSTTPGRIVRSAPLRATRPPDALQSSQETCA